jgi:hypothetical protein
VRSLKQAKLGDQRDIVGFDLGICMGLKSECCSDPQQAKFPHQDAADLAQDIASSVPVFVMPSLLALARRFSP